MGFAVGDEVDAVDGVVVGDAGWLTAVDAGGVRAEELRGVASPFAVVAAAGGAGPGVGCALGWVLWAVVAGGDGRVTVGA